ncbi:MAG: oxidative damage protection protein [bacterium]|nr:oxidative damage protection protein [bacterium]
MSEVSCSRCGSTAAGLDSAPIPGAEGQAILTRTCVACWQEWLRAQVILINEHRMSPADPEHYAKLMAEMQTFLNLDAG